MCSICASSKIHLFGFISAVIITTLPGVAIALSLAQAEQLALEADPLIKRYSASSRSHDAESSANATLPDPKLRLGMFNVPLDTFSTTEDPSTQLRIGIQQEFPRGDTTDLKQQQSKWLAQAAMAQANDEKLKLLMNVRDAYLNLYYEIKAGNIVNETRELFVKLAKITEDQVRALYEDVGGFGTLLLYRIGERHRRDVYCHWPGRRVRVRIACRHELHRAARQRRPVLVDDPAGADHHPARSQRAPLCQPAGNHESQEETH